MWFLILAAAFTMVALLVIVVGRLLGADFPFLVLLALGDREPKKEDDHAGAKSFRVGA